MKLAVCIVGQLARLEIESKVHNLLRSTNDQPTPPARLDVFLVQEAKGGGEEGRGGQDHSHQSPASV
eukprot:scaffold37_cov116-Isochrysis_galbana.AAC.2